MMMMGRLNTFPEGTHTVPHPTDVRSGYDGSLWAESSVVIGEPLLELSSELTANSFFGTVQSVVDAGSRKSYPLPHGGKCPPRGEFLLFILQQSTE